MSALDWNDRQTRRRLCTALIEIIYAHAPDGADVVDLAIHTPSLTFQEVEVVKAYFHGPSDRSQETASSGDSAPS